MKKKNIIRGFGLFGTVLFIPLFLFTFADPQLIENTGKEFVVGQAASLVPC